MSPSLEPKNSHFSKHLAQRINSLKDSVSDQELNNSLQSRNPIGASKYSVLQSEENIQHKTESQRQKEINNEEKNKKKNKIKEIGTNSTELSTSVQSRASVSEESEGKNWFRWCMGILVLTSAIIAVCGYFLVAVGILISADLVATTWRLVAQKESPWKVRSVKFDCIVGYFLAVLLMVMCVSLYFF